MLSFSAVYRHPPSSDSHALSAFMPTCRRFPTATYLHRFPSYCPTTSSPARSCGASFRTGPQSDRRRYRRRSRRRRCRWPPMAAPDRAATAMSRRTHEQPVAADGATIDARTSHAVIEIRTRYEHEHAQTHAPTPTRAHITTIGRTDGCIRMYIDWNGRRYDAKRPKVNKQRFTGDYDTWSG